MLKSLLFLFVGGGFGAVVRFLIGKYSVQFFESNFPVGTLVANLFACGLVGLLVYQFDLRFDETQKALYSLLVIGFCGGLSTFSTFSLETFELLKQGNYLFASLNLIISLVGGIAAVALLFKHQ